MNCIKIAVSVFWSMSVKTILCFKFRKKRLKKRKRTKCIEKYDANKVIIQSMLKFLGNNFALKVCLVAD